MEARRQSSGDAGREQLTGALITKRQRSGFANKTSNLGVSLVPEGREVFGTLSIAKRGYVVDNGIVALHGSSSALLNDDRMIKAYLGAH